MCAVSTLLAAGGPSFAGQRSYAIGTYWNQIGPWSLAIGDLNGDGKPDIATANSAASNRNRVSVLLNKGDGSFQTKRNYAAGGGSSSIAIGDLNGDAKADLATGSPGLNSVSVLLNRGDGSFQPGRRYGTEKNPQSVAIADLNGDDKPDLATANLDANSVSVLLNTGDGSFQAKHSYGTGKKPYSIAIGDLGGDGKPDLATANSRANTISVVRNTGDGSFQAKRDYRTGRYPTSVAIGDLNGDGNPDLATANNQKTISVLLNKGDGSFQTKHNYAIGGRDVVIRDVNGDAKADLATEHAGVVYNGPGVVSVLVNRGDGRFQPRLDFAIRDFAPWAMAIGDLNGDGNPDLATAHVQAFSVSVLLNRPGLCTVQNVAYMRVQEGIHDPNVTIVGGKTLPAAKRTLALANCRVGRIGHAYSRIVRRGRMISQRPRFGAVLPGGGKVNLVVSRGRKEPVKLAEPLESGFWMHVKIDTVCALQQQYQP